jgi:ParB family chromosome partitioning protein
MHRSAAAASVAKEKPAAPETNGKHPFVDGLNGATVVDVPLDDIDHEDLRYQCRFQIKINDVRASLATRGQEELVHLTDSKPHLIIDGFRRVTAMKELGWKTVKAIVHCGISDEKALELAYTLNSSRTNLKPVEKAHTIVLARKRGLKDDAIARMLGMSERQLHRIERLLELPKQIQGLVDGGEVSMAHAAVLAKFEGINVIDWALKTQDGKLSAGELRRELRKSGSSIAASKSRVLIKVGHEDCRLLSRYFSKKSPTDELTAAVDSLERCAGILRGWLAQRGIGNDANARRRTTSPTGLDRSADSKPSTMRGKRPKKICDDAAAADRE